MNIPLNTSNNIGHLKDNIWKHSWLNTEFRFHYLYTQIYSSTSLDINITIPTDKCKQGFKYFGQNSL